MVIYIDVVMLRQRINDVTSPSGIYRCEIPTIAVNDDVGNALGEWVYIGLYPPSEGIYIIILHFGGMGYCLLCGYVGSFVTSKTHHNGF